MFDTFARYLKEKAGLTGDEIDTIRAFSIEKQLGLRQYLLQEGEVCHHTCFVARGCLRLYRIDSDGGEHVLRFAAENWWISDRESYRTGHPSKSYIDSLESSDVILIDKPDFTRLTEQIPSLNRFTENLLARSFDAHQNRIMNYISTDAKAKYEQFISAFPNLANRVPLHMIASYLGVTRETLSRIRHQLAHP
ncbi:Crp/Fnr family transcriptional regulator [Spirosoma knui]